jgi:hypothetical protein
MTEYVINGKIIIPKRIFLNQTQWYLEGSENDKKILISLRTIGSFNGNFIDEIVIVRPLTNKIHVDAQTDDVLKIHVDQKDTVLFMAHENRQIAEGRPTISIAGIGDYNVINDTFVKTKRKKR